MSGNLIKSSGRGPAYCSRRIWADAEQEILTKHGMASGCSNFRACCFFGTATAFEEQIDKRIADGVECLILDFKQVTEIDISGARAIVRIARTMRRKNLFLAVSYIRKERRKASARITTTERRQLVDVRNIWRMFDLAGAVAVICGKQFFFDTDSALVACEGRLIATHKSAGNRSGQGRHRLLSSGSGKFCPLE